VSTLAFYSQSSIRSSISTTLGGLASHQPDRKPQGQRTAEHAVHSPGEEYSRVVDRIRALITWRQSEGQRLAIHDIASRKEVAEGRVV
jgi:hypothetical protein